MRLLNKLILALALAITLPTETQAGYRPTIILSSIGVAFAVATAVLGSLTSQRQGELHRSYSPTTLVVDGYNTSKEACEVCGTVMAMSTGCSKLAYTTQILCSYQAWVNETKVSLPSSALKICGDSENDAEKGAQSTFPIGSNASAAWYKVSDPITLTFSLWNLNQYLRYTIATSFLSAVGVVTGLVCGIREKWRRTYGYTVIV